jgi:hypothetical protein
MPRHRTLRSASALEREHLLAPVSYVVPTGGPKIKSDA